MYRTLGAPIDAQVFLKSQEGKMKGERRIAKSEERKAMSQVEQRLKGTYR
jgi:hypothetical protein